jgi:hypothetical protein
MTAKTPKNSVLFMTFLQGEDVIIMLKGKNAVTKRVSELPQSTKFENWCVA